MLGCRHSQWNARNCCGAAGFAISLADLLGRRIRPAQKLRRGSAARADQCRPTFSQAELWILPARDPRSEPIRYDPVVDRSSVDACPRRLATAALNEIR